jgi:hypothetical protein
MEEMGDMDDEDMEGGKKEKKEYTGTFRHFKIFEVDGKEFKSDARANIKEHHTPLIAARKLLSSMVREKKLNDNTKSKFKVIFSIKETTRDSKTKTKVYGPYQGSYHKYTPSEAAKAKTADGKVSLKFKPIVKLFKGSKEQKGGKQL